MSGSGSRDGVRAIKVLWVAQNAVAADMGGGTRHAELAAALAHCGVDVTVAASDFNLHARRYARRTSADDPRAIVEVVNGCRWLWLRATPYERNNWRRLMNWASFALSTLCLPQQERADIVVGSSPQPLAALAAWVLSVRWRVPFVLEVRDLWPETMEVMSRRRGLGYIGIGLIMRFLYRRAKSTVVLTEGVARYLEKWIRSDRLLFAPNGVSELQFGEVAEPGTHLPRQIIYAGAVGPLNGLDVLLHAMEGVDASQVRVRILGDGPSRAEVRQRALELGVANVTFEDPIPKREVPSELARMDAGLLLLRPSPLFAFGVSPNKLFDYMAAGLPVITNVAGEVSEIVAVNRAGFVAHDASAEALAKAVAAFCSTSAEELRAMGRRGREWVLRTRERKVVALSLAALFQHVVAKDRS